MRGLSTCAWYQVCMAASWKAIFCNSPARRNVLRLQFGRSTHYQALGLQIGQVERVKEKARWFLAVVAIANLCNVYIRGRRFIWPPWKVSGDWGLTPGHFAFGSRKLAKDLPLEQCRLRLTAVVPKAASQHREARMGHGFLIIGVTFDSYFFALRAQVRACVAPFRSFVASKL